MKDYMLDLDKPRELRFGFKAMRLIRQKFGDNKTTEQLLNIKVDEIPVLAWAGMKWSDPQLKLEQVEDLLDSVIPKKYTILKITEIIMEALSEQLGIESKKAPADGQKVKVEKEAQKMAEVVKQKVMETIPSTKKQKKQP